MNYYPFHLGDYAAHTSHLEPLEDLAYRRMLDLYYLRESALPQEPAEIARLIRMRSNVAEVEAVLREFFTNNDGDGWVHVRCEAEISKMQDKQAKAKASAAASVKARSTNAQRTLNERSTDAELPTPTPTPVVDTSPDGDGSPKHGFAANEALLDNCPHQRIIDLYHEHLPTAIRVREWTPSRAQALRTRWREKPQRQNLEWWERFFDYISESDFLMGRTQSAGRKPFEIDLEWICQSKNFVKVIEGKFHEAKEVAA